MGWEPFDGVTDLGDGYSLKSGDGFLILRTVSRGEQVGLVLPTELRLCRLIADAPEIDALRAEVESLRAEVESLRAAVDPFTPDWSSAPEWAEWHTVDDNNYGVFWNLPPRLEWEWEADPARAERYLCWTDYLAAEGEMGMYTDDSDVLPEAFDDELDERDRRWWERGQLDWRNSLRHRPD